MNKTDNYIKALEIIGYLNKKHLQGKSAYYDCEALGIVHIWWQHNRWE